MVKKSIPIKHTYISWKIWIPALVATLMYLTATKHGFVLDDNLVITKNEHLAEGISSIPQLLSTNYAHGHQGFNDGLYRPLSLITFAIESSIFSLHPAASHFIQALLYGLLVLVLVRWLRAMFPNREMSAFWIALLFAVHPLHTEVVANLKSRDEILALLFLLMAGLMFIKHLDSGSIKAMALTLALYLLALFSKESAITYAAIFPLMHYYIKGKQVLPIIRTSALVLIPALVFLAVRQVVLNNMGEVDSGVSGLLQNALTTADTYGERIATAASIQLMYFTRLFVPIQLSHDYSYNSIPVISLQAPEAIIGLLLVSLFAFLAIRGLITRTRLGFGISWYFITIAVVSNVFILIGALAAERFLFAPSLGWAIAFVALIEHPRFSEKAQKTVLGFVCLSFAVLTLQRIPDWKDNYSLFSADVDKVPESARAHYNLGTASNDRAKHHPREATALRKDAIQHLKRAIEIWPDYMDAYNNLGVVFIDQGSSEEAYALFKKTYERFPSYNKALFNLAVTAYNLKKYAEAEVYFESHYAAIPGNDALYMMAECQGYQSKFDEAKKTLEMLIKREPHRARAYLKLGMAYAITGDQGKAEELFNKAVETEPNNAEAHFNLALVYMNTNRPQLAKSRLQQALSLDPGMERARNLLEGL